MLMHCLLRHPLATPLVRADAVCAQCLRADLLRAAHGVPWVVGVVKHTGCECSEPVPSNSGVRTPGRASAVGTCAAVYAIS